MRSILLLSLLICLLRLSFAQETNVVLIPAFDNAGSGISGSFYEYLKDFKKLPNGISLVIRDDKLGASNMLAKAMDENSIKAANIGIVADVLSSKQRGLIKKSVVAFKYVDLSTGQVLFSRVKTGRKLFWSRPEATIKKATKRFIKIQPKNLGTDYQFNERKPGIIMVPPSGISMDARGRGLEGIISSIISRDERFNLIERRVLEYQLQEQGLTLAGVFKNNSSGAQVGKLSSIKYGLKYEVMNIRFEKQESEYVDVTVCYITIAFQVINFATGETLRVKILEYSGFGVFSGELGAFAMAVLFSMRGAESLLTHNLDHYIELESKDKIQKIAFGRKEGISRKHAYTLYRKNEVLDPFTRKQLGFDYEKIGSVSLKKLEEHEAQVKLKARDLASLPDVLVIKQSF